MDIADHIQLLGKLDFQGIRLISFSKKTTKNDNFKVKIFLNDAIGC